MTNKREFKIIGKRVPNVDVYEKVTGVAKYTGDLKLDRMIYGKVLRSPHPHAKINKIDISKAEALSGVVGVIVGKDVRHNSRILGSTVNDQSVLTEDKVRFIGDAVAAVGATTPEIADSFNNGSISKSWLRGVKKLPQRILTLRLRISSTTFT